MSKLSRVLAIITVFGTLTFLTGGVPSALAKSLVRLRAELVGPDIAGETPDGKANFRITDNHGKRLKVQVEDVNLPDGTMLNVSACGSSTVGVIALDDKEGKIDLREKKGASVPNCVSGNIVEVMNGTTTILSGTLMPKN